MRAPRPERTAVSESDREAIYDLFGIPHWRAHSLLGLADRLGALDSKPEVIDYGFWTKTRIELVADAVKPEGERSWPDDIRDYLLERLKEPERGRTNMRARDSLLVYVIKDLHDKYNLTPSRARNRHELRENLSGCAIVAIVLAELGKSIDEFHRRENLGNARSD